MLKQNQHHTSNQSSSTPMLKNWVLEGLQKKLGKAQKIRLQGRLRGNHLHLLCETSYPTLPEQVLNYLISEIKKSFKQDPHHFSLFSDPQAPPLYQIIVYGKVFSHKKHDWVKTIHIHPHKHSPVTHQVSESESIKGALISYKTLAQSGSPSAIARYLSHQFSYLGVSIKVNREKLPINEQKEETKYRLNVVCECNYSPEPTLLAEPITKELRKLELKGFGEGIIYAQVTGEAEPDWLLKIDLTPADLMLKEWANWGDAEAIIRLLNGNFNSQQILIQGELKQKTLHLFCSHHSEKSPEQKNIVPEITQFLDNLSPQGLEAVGIYGIRPVKNKKLIFDPQLQKEKPEWIAWHKLPASYSEELQKTPFELAQEDHIDALFFLINRALNQDLEWRLHTGGIKVQLKQKGDLLHILAEAVVCPAQSQVLPPLEKLFRQLTIKGIAGIRIYGRRAGQLNSLWHENIDFIKRKSSNHELLPEFTNLYYLEIDPSFLQEETDFKETTKTTVYPSKPNYLQLLAHQCQIILAKSGLFIPQNDQSFRDSNLNVQNDQLIAYKGLKVALVWGIVGILLTLQLDWLLGRRFVVPPQADASEMLGMPSETEKVTQSITLPEISLQKSEWESIETSHNDGFTQLGSQEIISEVEARDQKRSQESVTEILAEYKEKNPKFNNPFLEEKLALYQHRLEKEGVPDLVIIGSSRAMRGVDPDALKTALKEQGYPSFNIFNFGVNGATAKIVDLILRQLLPPEDLPKMVIFADGARAFNSGRNDMTYQMIENSQGYNQVLAGLFPPAKENDGSNQANSTLIKPSFSQQYQQVDQWLNETVSQFSSAYKEREKIKTTVKEQFVNLFDFINLIKFNDGNSKSDQNRETVTPNGIDYDGFFPLSMRFDPKTYYEDHPLVVGAYDSDYQNFNLEGEQHESFVNLINYLKKHNVQLIFINQPLTDNYLDQTRLKYEEKFNNYMQNLARDYNIVFRDFVNRKSWQTEYNFFSDPSHLNRYGAYQMAQELATDPSLNWGSLQSVTNNK